MSFFRLLPLLFAASFIVGAYLFCTLPVHVVYKDCYDRNSNKIVGVTCESSEPDNAFLQILIVLVVMLSTSGFLGSMMFSALSDEEPVKRKKK